MENKKKSPVATIILTIICILWMYPIVLILINSLKKEAAITTAGVFSLPTGETWNGIANFVASVTQMDFLKSFWYSLVISVMSVVLIMLCCSMCGLVYCSCKRSIIQDFLLPLCIQYGSSFPDGYVYTGKNSRYLKSQQSVQYLHHLSWIWCRTGSIYVYRICKRYSAGNRRGSSDRWMQSAAGIISRCLIPILKPTIISTAILELMWVWNDYLLPTLVLDIKKYRTIPMAVQYFRGSYRTCTDGTDDGKYYDRYYSDHHCIPGMPEIYY